MKRGPRQIPRIHRPTPEPIRLTYRRRQVLYWVSGLLLASGLLWLVFHFAQDKEALPSPWLAWSMKLHGAAAMLFLFLLGTLFYPHILTAWRSHRNRFNGGWFGATVLVLIGTGYGLYYFDGAMLRELTEWIHWAIGVLSPGVFIWHMVFGKRARIPLRVHSAKRRARGFPEDWTA